MDERPERERGPAWYDDAFSRGPHWHADYSQSPYYWLWDRVADRLVEAGARAVLDLGCGSGQFACLLRDRGLPHYHGLDFSPARVNHARRSCPEFSFAVVNVLTSDWGGLWAYDAAVCVEFLEHVMDDLPLLSKIKPGAYFVGTVPNFAYDSHVRHFAAAAEALTRYKGLFDDFTVEALPDREGQHVFYLLEGRRRQTGASLHPRGSPGSGSPSV